MKHCPICSQNFSDDVTTCKFDGNALVELVSAGDPLVGTTLNGRYKILDTIGHSSMSDVYFAEQIGIARKVVVKILAEDLSRDEACTKRFGQEARIVSALNHPNLVRIFDFDHTASNRLFMVTEYLPGHTLKEFLNSGAMSIPRAVRFASQIADGLDAVHQAGVIHRDLNSKNVMVIDNERNIKITNFGFAQLREAEAGARLTQVGTILGSPEYMAPEQIEGNETDERTDIYSLGIVLYEMLCNTVPFTAPTPAAIWMKHLHDDPVPPTKLRPEIRLELEHIVLCALQKKPELRWQRMRDVAEELRKTGRIPGQQSSTLSVNATTTLKTLPSLTEISAAQVTDPAEAVHRGTARTDKDFRTADATPQTVMLESFDTSTATSASEKSRYESVNNTNQTMPLTQALNVPARPRMYWKALSLGATTLLVGVVIVWLGVLSKPLSEDQKSPPDINVGQPAIKDIAPGKIVSVPEPSLAAEPKLVALTVKAAKRELIVNDSLNLQATGTYSDKQQLEIKAGVRWDSSDPNIATVTESGAVLGKKEGRVELIARYGGIASDPLSLRVKGASLSNRAIIQQSKKPPTTKAANPSEQIRNARSRLDRGEYAEALSELDKARKIDPGNQEVQAAIVDTKRACNAERKLGRVDLKC